MAETQAEAPAVEADPVAVPAVEPVLADVPEAVPVQKLPAESAPAPAPAPAAEAAPAPVVMPATSPVAAAPEPAPVAPTEEPPKAEEPAAAEATPAKASAPSSGRKTPRGSVTPKSPRGSLGGSATFPPSSPRAATTSEPATGVARPTQVTLLREQEARERRQRLLEQQEHTPKWSAVGHIDRDKLYHVSELLDTQPLPKSTSLRKAGQSPSSGSSPRVWRPNNTSRGFTCTGDANTPEKLLSTPSPRAKMLSRASSRSPSLGEFTKVVETPFTRSSKSAEDLHAGSRAKVCHTEAFPWLSSSPSASKQ
eukprot:TRINITY_DN7170_c0_g1_i2.p1 TRINITY_DN7170_c0_g1~~TRINITY_DN7170_c0_g1_i2.p1  ORF type:complete len:319 (+),score=65.55 TRINITY_DN7170_c0_g1_i2:31-957(+)